MQNIKWLSFISKAKQKYKQIGNIPCPAFSNELVYFNERGLNHLLMKNGKFRSKSEQVRRIRLIPYASKIIKNSKSFTEHYCSEKNGSYAHFWSLKYYFRDRLIIVVIRQIGTLGNKHFLSIMDKRLPKSAQTP